MTDEEYMKEALALAKEAFEMGEVPVGAVAVWDGKIVGRGMNRRETDKNALRHAEIEAIDEACKTLGGWRLWKCDLYVLDLPGGVGCAAAERWEDGRIFLREFLSTEGEEAHALALLGREFGVSKIRFRRPCRERMDLHTRPFGMIKWYRPEGAQRWGESRDGYFGFALE